ncbi:MAG: hypothetical protein K0R18_1604 [Bacillales bacterium]|nr:hypothetical protein [Bacillales bacterium]
MILFRVKKKKDEKYQGIQRLDGIMDEETFRIPLNKSSNLIMESMFKNIWIGWI